MIEPTPLPGTIAADIPFQSPYEPATTLTQQARDHWLAGVSAVNPSWYHGLYQPDGGKMFGVLVVRSPVGTAYLMGFSGMLDGQWEVPGFVPPVFDTAAGTNLLAEAADTIASFTAQLEALVTSERYRTAMTQLTDTKAFAALAIRRQEQINARQKKERELLRASGESLAIETANRQSQYDRAHSKRLKKQWAHKIHRAEEYLDRLNDEAQAYKRQRSQCSKRTQVEHFKLYALLNQAGETRNPLALFAPDMPPAGAGDCAAPKLLQAAWRRGYQPLALAEFWLGAPPAGQIRHDRQFYPPCRSRCAPILKHMLPSSRPLPKAVSSTRPEMPDILFEDDCLLVIDKPSGLLSVPGKTDAASVQSIVAARYPALHVLPVHRLDQDTSGVLLLAKSMETYRKLQHQFMSRSVDKRYVAILAGHPENYAPDNRASHEGWIKLPLRVDLEDRPRQMVCYDYGKEALTHYRILATSPNSTRVELTPHSGRTHQLRVHAAHIDGLNRPILGDALYGNNTMYPNRHDRLHLHAARLAIEHPASRKPLVITSATPF